MKGSDKNAGSEYRTLSKMGFISLEEVDAEEAAILLSSTNRPTAYERPAKKPRCVVKVESEQVELLAWAEYHLHPELLGGLHRAGFTTPTEVQKQVLSTVLSTGGERRDVLGSAPTGSGKTLAFLLPILHNILSNPTETLAALIVVPTRELALQIKEHLDKVAPPTIHSVTLVGGLSQEKQERLLGYAPHIIIGTPGRLAEVLSASTTLQTQLSQLQYLVLDEADRLCEKGHFKDLDTILELVHSKPNKARRTFLFSATLSPQVGALRKKLRFNDRKPTIIKVGNANPVSLEHYKLACLADDKLTWLCAILKQSGRGRTLVFVNTIELVRDLASTLQLLGLPAGSLHAQMQQRQRLKSLDRFRAHSDAVLVTSDVAARGLDIPNVQMIVHFHVPKVADVFAHRSGRTARADSVGISIAMVAPHESSLFHKVSANISMHEYTKVSLSDADNYRKAAALAEKIRKMENKESKATRNKSWEEKAAEALGVDLDFGAVKSKNNIDDDGETEQAKKNQQIQIQKLKSQLDEMLNKH
ncbi:P-loop containing nucleoside triphosphate hydrolases superfamily protein isoform 2 [Paramicrosporidium saccamoebae]|uniref:ATP-dependent RNA helicase n=1 Tax=Paramicrosporidium saccamoebae TaxID=1246581 RepID=A0A2H9TGS1_9FUNG|nr:P-loop containing nucleoside triphosphate hydrolases superfamily protein isoform 2 [Paramicrosporidium saccamoebae]